MKRNVYDFDKTIYKDSTSDFFGSICSVREKLL